MTTVEGLVAPGWEPVRDAFERNFAYGDSGAACCVYLDGEPVVDLVGGVADVATGRPWRPDTIVGVFSTTKGATAVCANLLVERGRLDPDAPVASYWPEFAANGKAEVLVRHVLSHSAGLPVVEGDFTLPEALAWFPVVEQLASQAPRWEPGTQVGYHMRTYGWLVGELVRRIDGRTPGRFFREEIAEPLRLDFWIGLPEAFEPRVARLIPPAEPEDPEVRALMAAVMAPGTLMGDALTGPADLFHYDEMWNSRAVHAAELPSSNGIASAHAVARLYASCVGRVDGVQTLAESTVAHATVTQIEGTDVVIGAPMRYGLGFSLGDAMSSAARPGAFGHSGAGGSLGLADAAHRIGFGYVMSKMVVGLAEDRRPRNLLRAAYRVLDDA
ncbi:MAG: serine hydrolase domain-containing protein [Acidimicrobiia bacterium]